MDRATYERVLAPRGISWEVAQNRHVPYEKGDVQAVLAADPLWEAKRNNAAFIVRQASGIAMLRHPVPHASQLRPERHTGFWFDGEPVFAELRPDHAIRMETRKAHLHADMAEKSRQAHILADRDIWEDADGNPLSDLSAGGHGGVDESEPHRHLKIAKYVFPKSDKAERGQIRKNYARRLDMHPLALPLLPDARRIFFALEGCLKADALLTAGECVFSVPSVSLWEANELMLFASKWLQGRPVFVLTDSDWSTNRDVRYFGLNATRWLKKHGVDAWLAAPPPAYKADGAPKKAGVDDYLAGGGTPDGIEIIEHRLPDGLRTAVQDSTGGYREGIRKRQEIVEWMALHATDDGLVKVSAQAIAAQTNMSTRMLHRHRQTLREAGLVVPALPSQPRFDKWTREWVTIAPVWRVNEALRAERIEPRRTVGDVSKR